MRLFLAFTLLAGFATASAADKKLVIVAGTVSHGPGDHEFNAGSLLLQKCLKGTPGLQVTVINNGWPQDDSVFDSADAIFLYMDGGAGHPGIKPERLKRLDALMKKGVGLGCGHFAVEVPKGEPGEAWQNWIGGHYEHLYSCNPMWEPDFTAFPKHPITRGVQPFKVKDEWYFNMRFRPDMKGVTPILVAKTSDEVRNGPYVYPRGPYQHIVDAKGRDETMMWAVEREDGGRGFGFTGGHRHANWGNENFRKVMLNALLWVSKVEVPEGGVQSSVTEDDLKQNLDPKNKR